VLCSDDDIKTSTKRGVAPLLQWLDEGENLSGYSAADKVIGKGAAFLYVLLGIKEVYANVISRRALEALENNNIYVKYKMLAEAILNRDNTGFCPIETAVCGISEPDAALAEIRETIKRLKGE
jgi:hypothetical protein